MLIPNGIDVEQFGRVRSLPRDEYMKRFAKVDRHPKIIIVSMGRLHRVKGFDVLIDAFARLLADFGGAVLLVAGGDDGEKRSLENQIARLNLVGKVFLVGEVSGQDKVDFLAGGDLFALPSHSENFGNAYLEAMAAGLPVVASTGTPWRGVEAAGCGRWVENSVEATYSAMTDVLRRDTKAMGRLARDYAKQFDWQGVAARFKAVFSEMTQS